MSRELKIKIHLFHINTSYVKMEHNIVKRI